MLKKTLGYLLAFVPALGALAVVVAYGLFVPLPATPPNITLRGTEIFIPVLFGLLFAIGCLIRIPFNKEVHGRRTLIIWAGIAISPLVVLLFYLWVLAPLGRGL